jgi:hypothetical protein
MEELNMDTLIEEIGRKHGVLLSKDDPILMLYTANRLLLKESGTRQEELLDDLWTEFEDAQKKWEASAVEKAEKILTAAIDTGESEIHKATERATTIISKEINAVSAIRLTRCSSLAYVNLIAAAVNVAAAITLLFILFK